MQALQHEKPAVERILNAALRLLGETDHDTLTMREIALEAGVSKSLLLYHFSDKEELVLAVIDGFFGSMIERMEKVTVALAKSQRKAPVAEWLEAIWTELRGSGAIPSLMLRLAAAATVDQALRARLVDFRSRLVRLMRDGLRTTLGADLEKARLDAITEMVVSLLIGFEVGRIFSNDPAVLDSGFELALTLTKSLVKAP